MYGRNTAMGILNIRQEKTGTNKSRARAREYKPHNAPDSPE